MGTARPPDGRPGPGRSVVGAAIGAGLGFAVAAGVYTGLVPLLEAADGVVRELQGVAWNLVPAGTLAGGLLGWAVGRRRGGG